MYEKDDGKYCLNFTRDSGDKLSFDFCTLSLASLANYQFCLYWFVCPPKVTSCQQTNYRVSTKVANRPNLYIYPKYYKYTANPFPVYSFSQGNPCNENRVPAMRTGFPCNKNRFFPVWKNSQGKPCSGPVLALYGIAVNTTAWILDIRYLNFQRPSIFPWRLFI